MVNSLSRSGAQPTRLMANRQYMEDRAAFLAEMQLWPTETELNVSGWLRNFSGGEEKYAAALLDGFMYFNKRLVNQLLRSAFHSISEARDRREERLFQSQRAWLRFVDSVYVTHVEGERPNPSSSGYLFARKARQQLGIPESRILGADKTRKYADEGRLNYVCLMDDFIGSGDQFLATWRREVEVAAGRYTSFKRIAEDGDVRFFYTPLFATEKGYRRIRRSCKGICLVPAHVLSERYSAVGEHLLFWPEPLRDGAESFLREASRRAAIPDGCTVHWKGYKRLGVCIAFSHGVPDATLPLLWYRSSNWTPLVERA